jgi:inositol monophosphatase 3
VQVIKGDVDAYVHVTRIKKWDICAGNALINAVGGEMTTLHGAKIDYDKSGDPKNDDGLLATVTEHKKFLDVFEPEFDALNTKH